MKNAQEYMDYFQKVFEKAMNEALKNNEDTEDYDKEDARVEATYHFLNYSTDYDAVAGMYLGYEGGNAFTALHTFRSEIADKPTVRDIDIINELRKASGLNTEYLEYVTMNELQAMKNGSDKLKAIYQSEGNKEAFYRQEEIHIDICQMIEKLSKAVVDIKMYVSSDTMQKERFTDIEICCEDDNELANEELDEILESYTFNKCKPILTEIDWAVRASAS